MDRLKYLLELGMPQCRAAEKVGINRGTFQAWLALGRAATSGEYHDFSNMVATAQETREINALADLIRLGKKDYRALLYSLQLIDKDDYAPARTDLTGLGVAVPEGGAMEITTTLKIIAPRFLDAKIDDDNGVVEVEVPLQLPGDVEE
jgi:hypothetical protein